ncbi:MAG: hypothetical protein AAFP19_16520, partial [Bacteroidota bacterium]
MKLSNKQLGEVVDELQHEMRCLIHKETGKIEILFGHDSLLYMDLETFEADQNRIKEPEKYIVNYRDQRGFRFFLSLYGSST